jgi:cytochrome c-type biogenesis protein
MLQAVVALFGAGIVSFLAPCVLPLVPAYLAMVTGEASRSDTAEVVRATVVFVVGFTVVFVALGLLAGAAGRALDRVQGVVQLVGGVSIILFGLVLVGALRGRFLRTVRLPVRLPSTGVARPFVLGLTFGTAWTPCVGPLLGASLVTAAHGESATRGALLLAAYSLGLGAPFVAAALSVTSVPALLRAMRRRSVAIARVSGVVLVLLGVLLVTGRYRSALSPLARIWPGLG